MSWEIRQGDCIEVLRAMDAGSVQCVVTSPPYWGLRDYGVGGQLGLEPTLDEYIGKMVEVFREVRRVLRDDGTVFCNLGDAYYNGGAEKRHGGHGFVDGGKRKLEAAKGSLLCRAHFIQGLKPKDLIGQPWRLAFALQADGWYLRSDIIWSKPNPMPESVTDRPTKSHEYVFLLTKQPRYYYDADAVREKGISGYPSSRMLSGDWTPGTRNALGVGNNLASATIRSHVEHPAGRNLRTVWTIPTQPYKEAHFATYPEKLVAPCIKAGTSEKGCCPECGAGWVRVVEMTDEYKTLLESGKAWRTNEGKPDDYTNRQEKGHVSQVPAKHRTIGWQAGCTGGECHSGIGLCVPCTVLDPFCGSGTTGVVAKQLGRDFIGIELNAEYAELARKRIANPYPEPEVPDVEGQMTMEW